MDTLRDGRAFWRQPHEAWQLFRMQGPASNRESLVMVSHLLDAKEVRGDLENLTLEKTKGVPLFIEEFIRSLKDLKIIERKGNRYLFARDFLEMSIPSTIQDVIMARVDDIPEGAK